MSDETLQSLTQSVRSLSEASLRTNLDPDELQQIISELAEIEARLRSDIAPTSQSQPGPVSGWVGTFGNAVVGLRNPVAPPLKIERSDDGRARSTFHLNSLYEGPRALVHGGVSAMILDQVMGEAAAAGRKPGMTGTLTLRYRRPTPLGDLEAIAWISATSGYKTTVKGQLGPIGEDPSVEAEGLFIRPRWARDQEESEATFE